MHGSWNSLEFGETAAKIAAALGDDYATVLARALPPDTTLRDTTDMRGCHAEHPAGDLICTRLEDHTGRHAAGNGDHIVAVWDDPDQPWTVAELLAYVAVLDRIPA